MTFKFKNINRSLNARFKGLLSITILTIVMLGCNDISDIQPPSLDGERVTIFFINDPHAEMGNFGKIKNIVDAERNVNRTLLVSAGDLFSGSPYVDQYVEPGLPMIDLMNKVGFDLSVLGNHEFDYGLEELQERVDDSNFSWICANVTSAGTALNQPAAFRTIEIDGLRVTFLGFVETEGREGVVAPAAHPWRMRGLEFEDHKSTIRNYVNLKEDENSDVVIGLTHLGLDNDISLANTYDFLDAVIGGHSHDLSTQYFNNTPVLMAGAFLNYLGKLELIVDDEGAILSRVSLIDLNAYTESDESIDEVSNSYSNNPVFDEVVGNTETAMDDIGEAGCFFTTALKSELQVDITIQNLGGLRSRIDEGEITKFEIYELDPFNNQAVIYRITASELKSFLQETSLAISYTGLNITKSGDEIVLTDTNGDPIDDNTTFTLGMNDFIPALYEDYFTFDQVDIQDRTTAEVLIDYLENGLPFINFEGCSRNFDYD